MRALRKILAIVSCALLFTTVIDLASLPVVTNSTSSLATPLARLVSPVYFRAEAAGIYSIVSAPLADTLPTDGWQVCGSYGDNIHFKLCNDFYGYVVKVHCVQSEEPIPPDGTFCSIVDYDPVTFWCNCQPCQNLELDEVIEWPPPPPPPPVLQSFTLTTFCSTQGQHSNDLTVEVRAFNDQGGPFAGAGVLLTFGDGAVTGGVTDGNGLFPYTAPDAREMIGTEVKVEVGNLAPQFFTITTELFAPCTAYCTSLVGVYDPAEELVNLTGSGGPAGMGYMVWDITLGANTVLSSGTVDASETFTGVDSEPVWGLNLYRAQIGGPIGPVCNAVVHVPYPARIELSGSCTTPGQDSADLDISGSIFDQFDKPFKDPVGVTLRYPDGTQEAITVEGGVFGSPVFEGAKAHIGQEIQAFIPQGGSGKLLITSEMFAACVTPPTPTRTATPPPGPGNDPNAAAVPMMSHITPTPWSTAVSMASVFVPNTPVPMPAPGVNAWNVAHTLRFPLIGVVVLLVIGVVVFLWRRID